MMRFLWLYIFLPSTLLAQEAVFVPQEVTHDLVVSNHVRTMTITENFYTSVKDKKPALTSVYAVVNFDRNGLATSQVYRHNLQRSEFKYDKNNHVIEIDYLDSFLRPIGVSKYGWDENGRKIRQSWKDYQYPINTYSQELTYTSSGKLSQTVMVDAHGALREKYIYIYDRFDSLGWVTYVTPTITSTTRMSDRQVICIVYSDQSGNFEHQVRTEYNGEGKTARTYDSTAKKIVISDYFYRNGELIKVVDSHGNVLFDKDKLQSESGEGEHAGNDPPVNLGGIQNAGGTGAISPRRTEFLPNGLLSKEFLPAIENSTVTTHEYSYTYWQ